MRHAPLCTSQEWLSYGVRAVFSDETEQFRAPFEPECGAEVKIRIRTWKNSVDRVALMWGDQDYAMTCTKTEGCFDFHECSIRIGAEKVTYYFVLCRGEEVFYYNKAGLSEQIPTFGDFVIYPGFSTPGWARGAVMYQIFTDRFFNGDKTNDVRTGEYSYIDAHSQQVTDWNKPPATVGIREFYGGDLQGILDKLDYLQDLGVEVLYLNPIFVSPSNHKYDSQDYENVDPHLGKIVKDCDCVLRPDDQDNRNAKQYILRVTAKENLEASNQLFVQLVEELHRRGMRIILDGVFNHCGSFNKWMDKERIYDSAAGYEKGAYVSKDSPYHSYFYFKENKWPFNKSYEAWWDFDTLPKLNYEESEKLEEHILDIGKKWVSAPYCIDGWRLDVAADLGHTPQYNHAFWKKYRKAVKEANPEAIILAEHYGDPSPWLQGDEWDTVMNYDAFMEPVTWFLTGMEKHSDEYRPDLEGNGKAFHDAMIRNMAKFSGTSLHCAMNQLSNHDHSRFMTRTNHIAGRVAAHGSAAAGRGIDKSIMQLAVFMQMTLPGAPTIYYGDEAGQVGFTDPDNRRTFPWGREDWELIQFHKDLLRIRRKHPALRYGSMKPLTYGEDYLSYGRFDENGCLAAAINRSEASKQIAIPVWELGVSKDQTTDMEIVFTSKPKGHSVAKQLLPVIDGVLTVELGPKSGVLIRSI